jgi:tRNA A-37 threonylcarbamoyl transferase component Bud32
MHKQSSMLTVQVIRDGLRYIFGGSFSLRDSHLPPSNRTVPEDFFGVGVASNPAPETDVYIINQLRILGVLQVRLDLSYGDTTSYQGRFCEALLDAGFAVTLRLIPPFESAKNMHLMDEQANWQAFVDEVIERYGSRIKQIEIGNTINRKRWAGYNWQGFFAAWDIAYKAIKAHKIILLGPNIQDFEPLYNISLLKSLYEKNQLPDVQTNNLFVERVSEPERFDHRVLKYHWAKIFKFNLVKKARLLAKIGQDFDVPQTSSTGAFWAIYRIERKLMYGPQKQADYLTRYFTLLAASGAIRQAFWGTFLCHREGLIDDGLQDADYPALERIAHYKLADGEPTHYKPLPSFYAMQTVVNKLSGAQYFGFLASGAGVEIHRFLQHGQQLHVAWTINGTAVPLSEIYTRTSLTAANYVHRDGNDFDQNTPDLLSEEPIYISWQKDFAVETVTKLHISKPSTTKPLTIDAHQPESVYFSCTQPGWQGVILVKNHAEVTQIMTALNPENFVAPEKLQALRHARNAIWAIPHPTDINRQITVKKPVKMYWHKTLLDRYRPSKARRSWNGAMQLSRRGIETAKPIAFFEREHDKTLKQNFYICEYVQADCHIGQIFNAFSAGETEFMGVTQEQVYAQLARFIVKMHSRGCYFRDLSGGNILININTDTLQFTLIDTARARFSDFSVPMHQRLADLTRACHKLNWQSRERFLGHYLGSIGRPLTWYYKLPFYLYDAKVWLKRRVGRKGIKKLMQKIKST